MVKLTSAGFKYDSSTSSCTMSLTLSSPKLFIRHVSLFSAMCVLLKILSNPPCLDSMWISLCQKISVSSVVRRSCSFSGACCFLSCSDMIQAAVSTKRKKPASVRSSRLNLLTRMPKNFSEPSTLNNYAVTTATCAPPDCRDGDVSSLRLFARVASFMGAI